ncbi:MAG: hypothetical protein V9E83_11555 [Baekduia sp.]
MRMRQSLAQLERAFIEQTEAQEDSATELQRDVELRSRRRELERTNRQGQLRFWALVLVLLAVAVGTATGMFELLLWVMS